MEIPLIFRFDIEKGSGSSLHRPVNLENLHGSKYGKGWRNCSQLHAIQKRFFVKNKRWAGGDLKKCGFLTTCPRVNAERGAAPFAGLIEFIVNFRRTYLSTLMAGLRPLLRPRCCAGFALSFPPFCHAWYGMHTAPWNFNRVIMRWKFVRTLDRYTPSSHTCTFSFRVQWPRNNKMGDLCT